jgi:hypothetical protein
MVSNMGPFPSFSRRQLLSGIGGGFGLFALRSVCGAAENPFAPKAPHFAPKAKHVIFLFMNGGMSQVDTFDPKPMLAKYNGQQAPGGNPKTERKTGSLMQSPFAFRKCGQSGIEVSEIFPKIGDRIDDICVIRSMYTDIPNHEPSLQMMNCGENLQSRPSMGSWLLYGLGTENQDLPGYVVMCPGMPVVGSPLWNSSFLPAVYQGVHIPNNVKDPREMIRYLRDTTRSPDSKRPQVDLIQQLNRWHAEEREKDSQLEAAMYSMEVAFRMQTEAPEAFDISREPEAIRQKLARQVDDPVAALLDDLKATGLFKDTLVIFGGEFGRTPAVETSSRVKVQNGRDHNPFGFSMWLAGGGIKGGIAYGATDEFGFKAEENRVHVHDLHATILHLMGLDHTRLTYTYSGRDFRLTDVHGNIIRPILA